MKQVREREKEGGREGATTSPSPFSAVWELGRTRSGRRRASKPNLSLSLSLSLTSSAREGEIQFQIPPPLRWSDEINEGHRMMNHTVRLTGAILGEENKEEESSGEISSWTGRPDGPLWPPPPLIDRANIKDKGQPAATAAATLQQQQLNNSRTAMATAATATAPPPPRRPSSTEQKSGIDYFMTLKRSSVPSLTPSLSPVRHVISLAVQKAQILRTKSSSTTPSERQAPV